MSFATENYVAQMRNLLPEFGANESDDDRKHLELRQRAGFAEKIMISNERNIDENYEPRSGGCEM